MSEIEIYNSIRWEIVINHVLLHLTTLVVVISLLAGTWLVQDRKSIIGAILPLLSLTWAAAIVRFDLFIHRQGAYLLVVEARLQELGMSIPLWETWKASLQSTRIIVPLTDFLAVLIIIIITIHLLFGPTQEFFISKQWRGGKLYAWSVLGVLWLLLLSLLFIPKIAEK
jgi:type IV secretory pathway VirB2 component (pilin)